MFDEDFGLTAGWGHFGPGQAVMPGQGHAVERAYTALRALCPGHCHVDTLGETTYDIHLNDNAYWRNVPVNVWNYQAGWIPGVEEVVVVSGRERCSGRALKVDEVGYFSEVGRRISAMLLTTYCGPCAL